jgi:hypothetical protein
VIISLSSSDCVINSAEFEKLASTWKTLQILKHPGDPNALENAKHSGESVNHINHVNHANHVNHVNPGESGNPKILWRIARLPASASGIHTYYQ